MGKTVNNQLLWACYTANYDTLRLAKAYEIDTDALREGLKQSSGDNYALHRGSRPRGSGPRTTSASSSNSPRSTTSTCSRLSVPATR